MIKNIILSIVKAFRITSYLGKIKLRMGIKARKIKTIRMSCTNADDWREKSKSIIINKKRRVKTIIREL